MNLHGAAWLILDDLTGEVQALDRHFAGSWLDWCSSWPP